MSDSKGSEEGSKARVHGLPAHPSHWDLVDKHHNFSMLHRPTMAKYRDNKTGTTYRWNSRAHRKGVFPRVLSSEYQHIRPSFRLWSWEWQSISWWVCQMFLIGVSFFRLCDLSLITVLLLVCEWYLFLSYFECVCCRNL